VDTAFFGLKEDEALAGLLRKLEYILFVGRIVPQKDVLGIVRVFAEVQKRRPETHLLLVGDTEVLPTYVGKVKSEIQRLDLVHRVQITGKVSDRSALTALFRNAKFLICLSDWESFFVPAVEAMFCGVPVIHTGVPPVSEHVGDAGVVIDKQNLVSAGARIITFLNDAEAYRELRDKALAHSAHFTVTALADELKGVLGEWARMFGDVYGHE
jgi:glycosyltransferase involved in cell wall biosynthesis